MRKTSERELDIHTSQFVRDPAEGGVIVIERRGEPVAGLRPISASAAMPPARKAAIFASMKSVWEPMPQVRDGAGIIEEDRNR